MSDYIKREDEKMKAWVGNEDNSIVWWRHEGWDAPRKAKLIEVIKVYESIVRCEDCKYNDNGWCGNIEFGTRHVEPSDYCSDGERKDDE